MFKKKLPELILLIISIILFIIIYNYYNNIPPNKKNIPPKNKHKTEYGIITDSLIVYKDIITKNQNLSEILLKYNIDYSTIDSLSKKSKNTFDVKKIKTGNKYTILLSNDSVQKAQYFIYENSPASYVIFKLKKPIQVYTGQKEIKTEIKITSGIIETSLWNTMIENKTNPNLAIYLSEIYAWTIDFYGLQKQDKYKVIYEEISVEGKTIGIGRILASLFYHNNKDFYAFYFVQDSTGDYFDEKANSLRRTFLKAPLRFTRISSRFSHSRLHPILRIRRPHFGVDYAAPTGTPVHALGDGIIIQVARNGGFGKQIKIKHNSIYTTAYAHLSKYEKGIKKGNFVKQGDIIGYVGTTGMSTGPHLDFRFYKNGQPTDPLKVKSPPANPVDSIYINKYNELKSKMFKQLNNIKLKK